MPSHIQESPPTPTLFRLCLPPLNLVPAPSWGPSGLGVSTGCVVSVPLSHQCCSPGQTQRPCPLGLLPLKAPFPKTHTKQATRLLANQHPPPNVHLLQGPGCSLASARRTQAAPLRLRAHKTIPGARASAHSGASEQRLGPGPPSLLPGTEPRPAHARLCSPRKRDSRSGLGTHGVHAATRRPCAQRHGSGPRPPAPASRPPQPGRPRPAPAMPRAPPPPPPRPPPRRSAPPLAGGSVSPAAPGRRRRGARGATRMSEVRPRSQKPARPEPARPPGWLAPLGEGLVFPEPQSAPPQMGVRGAPPPRVAAGVKRVWLAGTGAPGGSVGPPAPSQAGCFTHLSPGVSTPLPSDSLQEPEVQSLAAPTCLGRCGLLS